jgi:hypothetical protein
MDYRVKAESIGNIFTLSFVELFKGRKLIEKGKINLSRWAIPLLSNNELRHAFIGIVFSTVINFIPVDEKDQIGILLDGTGFPEI